MAFNRKGQQEIVGFVLIVVLVVVGLMVFLVLSLRTSDEGDDSLEVANILSAVMKHTTECAIVREPDYDDFEDLFKSCNGGKRCNNLGEDACDYLNESLRNVVEALMATEASVSAYQVDFFAEEEDGQIGLLQIAEGSCAGTVSAAQRKIGDLFVRMKICTPISV